MINHAFPTTFVRYKFNHVTLKSMKYTFRISFFLKKSTVRKNGKSPIIARITLNGEKVEFSTKLGIAASQWNTDIGEVKGNSKALCFINIPRMTSIWII